MSNPLLYTTMSHGERNDFKIPNQNLIFNPCDPHSIQRLLTRFGPEVLFEIAKILESACLVDTLKGRLEGRK